MTTSSPDIENNSKKFDIESVVKTSSLVYAFLVFCGALYLEIYYGTFHINIFRYLNLSEILVAFLSILIEILFFAIGLLLYVMSIKYILRGFRFLEGTINRFATKIRIYFGVKEKEKKTVYWDVFGTYHTYKKGLLVILMVLSFAFVYIIRNAQLNSSYIKGDNFLILNFWIIFLIICCGLIVAEYETGNGNEIKYIVFYAMMALIVSTAFWSADRIHGTVTGYKNDTIILKDNDTIKTDSSKFYIGRTIDYLFIYHPLEKGTEVIPASEIKKIVFREK